MVKWLGISALAVAAFVVLMTAGSGRAAEPSPAVKAATSAPKPAAPPAAAKDGAPSAAKDVATKPAAVAAVPVKADKTEKDVKDARSAEAARAGQTGQGAPLAKAGSKVTDAEAGDAPKSGAASAATAHRTKSKRKRDGSAGDDEPELPPGQGPPPPSPLSVNDLHQEANRERGPGGDFNAPPRVKLEQLLSEVGKARQSLHDDTLKLEALAGNDPSRSGESAAPDAPTPAAPGAPGQAPQKNPLDVLAKALRGIKPEQAGPIVARLDKGLAATVLLKMPPADAGKIMGALKPEVAAELATQIAMRAPSPQAGGKR